MYLLSDAGKPKKGELRVQLLGSGTILREVIAAVDLLDKELGIKADVWSLPQLHRAASRRVDAERWNRLNPEEVPMPWVTRSCRAAAVQRLSRD